MDQRTRHERPTLLSFQTRGLVSEKPFGLHLPATGLGLCNLCSSSQFLPLGRVLAGLQSHDFTQFVADAKRSKQWTISLNSQLLGHTGMTCRTGETVLLRRSPLRRDRIWQSCAEICHLQISKKVGCNRYYIDAIRLEAIALRLEAISRLEAIASRLEAISLTLEATSSPLTAGGADQTSKPVSLH